VACYLATPGEVGTDRILRACFEAGKTVAVPARRGAPSDYGLCLLTPGAPLRAGALGILEPAVLEWVEAGGMDLIVVPGVAFDAAGRRLGHGLGCYDRLLADAGRAFKAGLAFDWQLVPEVPADAHDVAMDAVVTERALYGAGILDVPILNTHTTTKGKG
jgi:5-formyltetrahydrofolate cyclo-ligase